MSSSESGDRPDPGGRPPERRVPDRAPDRARPERTGERAPAPPSGGRAARRAAAEEPTVKLETAKPSGERAATRRSGKQAGRKRRKRLGVFVLAAVVLLGAVVGGGLFVFTSFFSTPDFEGEGRGDVVVQVEDGDTTTKIAGILVESGVVKSAAAFTRAAAKDDRSRSIQPGYYQVRFEMSGAAAVALMLDPSARIGQLEIRGGVQLDDTRGGDGSTVPGVLSLISEATCATLDGERKCVTVDELRSTMSTTEPAALGVPTWALEAVERADPVRRLEGLLVPGRYDVKPGAPAAEVLSALLATSATRLEAAGLVSGAQAIGADPYEVLIISSLVEKEAITPDMPKVARVIYNRLGAGQRLELDSMVNYPLDLQALRTTAADRAKPGPYNSYTTAGLPPTPISAPGNNAISAALTPEPGSWYFFVRCKTDGSSCFAETFNDHSRNVQAARAAGAF